MKVRRPYAFCCIEGGGRPSGCVCDKPDHGYAIVNARAILPGDEPLHERVAPARMKAALVNLRGHAHDVIEQNSRNKVAVALARSVLAATDEAAATPSQRLDAATVERCAQVCDALAQEKRISIHPKDHPMSGGIVDGMLERAASAYECAANRIRALATEPHQHGGKGA